VIDDQRREAIHWTDGQGAARQATLPFVVFHR
jgi:hypothetical protein